MRNKQQYLWEVTVECMRELDALNIPYGKVHEVTINTRAKRRWGQCQKRNGVYRINISDRLLGENVSKDALKHTVIHELLHTVPNCMNHREPWKAVADKVNKAYGYNIKRCTSSEEKGLDDTDVEETRRRTSTIKHLFKCTGCGQQIERVRESKFTRNPQNYRCGKCGSRFEKLF